MHWFERRIRRYEHRRWTTDDNRRVQPFDWGLEHIDGDPGDPDAAAYVHRYARNAMDTSREWFATTPADDYRLDAENVLTFTSSIVSPRPENNLVHAQFFPTRHRKAAVLLLPNWNAKWHGQRGLCEWLQRIGISVLRLSLPYHDRRMAKGHERADQLVGPNIGLTLQANRQAVQDSRRCLRWLEQQGFSRLGILGTSIGSSVGYITLVHDDALRAGGFFHVSTYFADVVSQGMTTNHVWESLRHHVTVDELRDFLGPGQSDAVRRARLGGRQERIDGVWQVRPDVPARADHSDAGGAPAARRASAHAGIALRPLLAGVATVQPHCWVSHADISALRFGVVAKVEWCGVVRCADPKTVDGRSVEQGGERSAGNGGGDGFDVGS